MQKSKLKWLASLAITAGILGACGDEKQISQGKASNDYEITVGLSQSAGGVLVDIAHQEGYFEEENIEVNRVGFANSADGLNALQAGKIDVGLTFGTAGPLTFIANGSDFSIIGGHLEGGHPILTKKENAGQYTSLESYKGKKSVQSVFSLRISCSDQRLKMQALTGKQTWKLLNLKQVVCYLKLLHPGKWMLPYLPTHFMHRG